MCNSSVSTYTNAVLAAKWVKVGQSGSKWVKSNFSTRNSLEGAIASTRIVSCFNLLRRSLKTCRSRCTGVLTPELESHISEMSSSMRNREDICSYSPSAIVEFSWRYGVLAQTIMHLYTHQCVHLNSYASKE